MATDAHPRHPRVYLAWCSVLHVITDGYIASISLLLPFMAADLGLSYTQSGLIKTASHGAISLFQIPAGLLSERIGEVLLLGLGLAWHSASFMALLMAVGFPLTLLLIFSSGAGGSVYHPVGTGLVSNVYPPHKNGPAIGTLNFFGDVGKVIFPALAGLLVIRVGWQSSFATLGCIGGTFAVLFLIFFRREIGHRRRNIARNNVEPKVSGISFWRRGIRRPRQFSLYAVIGFLDEAVRASATTFLGFLLIRNGIEENAIGWFVSLAFFGGAFGKLLCGLPIQKLGPKVIILTTMLLKLLCCAALPSVAPGWQLVLLIPLFGFVLNGTSSVFYIGIVPTFQPQYRSRGYSIYYTISFVAAALSPLVLGLVGDSHGLEAIYYSAAGIIAIAMPLAFFLKAHEPVDDTDQAS